MTRLLLLVAFLFFAGCATTTSKPSYINVSGEGDSENSALQAAFTKAVEQVTGVLVLSERESQGYKLAKNDILGYSSGYVDDFKVINSENMGGKVYLNVDVWVSDSKIKNRIIAESKSIKDFNGARHDAQYNTYLNSRESADKILIQILSDYPVRAFNIYQYPYKIELDNYRKAIVHIPFKFTWNPNYMESLNDALERIQDVPNLTQPHKGYIDTVVKKPKDYFGSHNRYYFNDMTILYKLNTVLDSIAPMIKVKALANNNISIIEGCVNPKSYLNSRIGEEFFQIRAVNTFLKGNIEAAGIITLNVPPDQSNLFSSMNRVELSVVSHYKC